MSALFCIHGHFYQPSRENPWLDFVEVDDSAAPAHDWNDRVNLECYAPNASARMLDGKGRIARIANNYASISFDLAPSLGRWLERHAPEVYSAFQEADRRSVAERGFGNAVAHPYTHVILPLAPRQEKMVQVRWGIADFRRRFGRPPEGMWLPETAVDNETLAVLAECGIAYTILAPHQARRVRAAPSGEWVEVRPEVLDTTRAYTCRPAAGLSIALFFYDGPMSRDVAFGGLLESGDEMVGRLLAAASDSEWSGGSLVHIATDGETYGHHRKFGEMALARATSVLDGGGDGEVTNYAAFLADHPPTHEVEINERTSWSCAHGIERWRSDCGCRTRGDWHQRWRGPLRESLEWLREECDALAEEAGPRLLYDPQAARDSYIEVLQNGNRGATERFLAGQALRPRDPGDRRAVLSLMEMQRHAMQMFASDGWFFDEISRAEPVQLLRHAARVIQLAARFGRELEAPFLERLGGAEGNLPAYPDGRAVYERLARPASVDARRVAAHHAITSIFADQPDESEIYSYAVARRGWRRVARGPHTLLLGRVQVTERQTGEADLVSCAALHMGGTEVHCCVAAGWDEEAHAFASDALALAIETGAVAEVIRQMDDLFGRRSYTLRDLFAEERRQVLARLSAETLTRLESSYRQIYLESRGLMATLRDADVPVPKEFTAAVEFILTSDLSRAIAAPGVLGDGAWQALEELRSWGIAAATEVFEPLLRARVEQRLRDAEGLFLVENLQEIGRTLDLASDAGITVNLWQAQNLFQTRLLPLLHGLEQGPPGEASLEAARAALETAAERLYFSR